MKTIAMTDVETGGLDPKVDEILGIGLVVFESEPPFKVLDTLDIKVKPEHIETASPQALAINGYNEKDWEAAIPLGGAMDLYRSKARGSMFAAHNVTFDWGFIGDSKRKFDDFDRHKIDTLSLAWGIIPHDKIKSWSLKGICEYLGIEPEPQIHNALTGATKAYEVYVKLMDRPIPLL